MSTLRDFIFRKNFCQLPPKMFIPANWRMKTGGTGYGFFTKTYLNIVV
jgi:hypothetical protein